MSNKTKVVAIRVTEEQYDGLKLLADGRLMKLGESKCNPRALGHNGDGSTDAGLLQINSSWRTLTARTCKRPWRSVIRSLTDPSCNLKVARVLWADGKGASNWRVSSGK